MEERILVMNNSRFHEQKVDGHWQVKPMKRDAMEPGRIPPGAYSLSSATPADTKAKGNYEGVVVHADSKNVYQATGQNEVTSHEIGRFKNPPAIGQQVAIAYQYDRAQLRGRDDKEQER